MKRFENKVVFVTGGTRGIGLGCVEGFLREGATVAFCGRSQESVERAKETLHERGLTRAFGFVADVKRKDDVESVAAAIERDFGGLDILVNNAGVGGGTPFPEITLEQWDEVINTNLRGTFLVSQACFPLLQRRGGGVIINVSSVAGQTGGLAAGSHYAAAKAGVLGLTKSLATQLARHNIRVNAVAPADIETDMTSGWPASLRETLIARTPLSRFGSVEEVVAAVLFLASDESSFITGQTLSVNGGLYMS